VLKKVNNQAHGGPGKRRGAFTLVELLIAIALLVILGSMVLGTLRYGTDLWRAGNTRSYCYDTATVVFGQLGKDLGASLSQFWNKDADAYDNRIRFVVDPDNPPVILPATVPPRGREQRLRFVAKIPDNTVNPIIRRAGNGSDDDVPVNARIDEDYYSLNNNYPPGGTGKAIDLKPLEGMCEVAYMMGTGARDSKTLYRSVLAPIGDANSLFVDANITAPGSPPSSVGIPVTEDVVLYLELRLWSQYTTTWDVAAPYTAWLNSWTPEYCGPAARWNSQGVITDDPLVPSSYRDNVFPRAVMAVVVVEPPESLRGPARLTLRAPIGPNDLYIPVSGALPAYNAAWPYILIKDPTNGNEWVRFKSFDATMQRFVLDAADPLGNRGVRSPTPNPTSHNAGCEVSIGLTFSTVFYNPAGRESW